MASSGSYFPSKFKNSKCRTISKTKRGSMVRKTCAPGSGTYHNSIGWKSRGNR